MQVRFEFFKMNGSNLGSIFCRIQELKSGVVLRAGAGNGAGCLSMLSYHFTTHQWTLAVLAALCIGMAKSGISGLGMLPVLLMADVVPARESTGLVLPLLICGDVLASLRFQHPRGLEAS